MRRIALLLAICALALPGGAIAAERDVRMENNSFIPSRTIALRGDTVRWTNRDFAVHNSRERERSEWRSPNLSRGDSFAHVFESLGSFRYHCTIHPFMTGQVAVYDLYLAAPTSPVTHGRRPVLTGLAPENSTVVIQRASDGATVATVTAGASRRFSVAVPSAPGQYRAVSGDRTSGLVRVAVRPKVAISARRTGRRVVVFVSTSPSQAGAQIVLERRRGSSWLRLASKRLDARSKATFSLAPRAMQIRARLVRGVQGYAPAASRVISVRR